MNTLIVSTSLNVNSNSRKLALYAKDKLADKANYIDLQDYNLPLCDGDTCYNHPNVIKIKPIIEEAKFIIMCIPVYNFGSGSSSKNLID